MLIIQPYLVPVVPSETCPDPVQGVQVGGSQQTWPPQNAQGQLLCPLLPSLDAKPPHSSLFTGAALSLFFFQQQEVSASEGCVAPRC